MNSALSVVSVLEKPPPKLPPTFTGTKISQKDSLMFRRYWHCML